MKRGRSGTVRCTNKLGNDTASSLVPGDSLATRHPGTPSVCTLVLMWPFARFSWPSSRRGCTCRGAQSEGVFSGKCPDENLQRSPGTEEGWRSSWTGVALARRANWPPKRRWCVHCTVTALQTTSCRVRWGCTESSQAEERSHAPGAPRSPADAQLVVGGWRPVVT